MTATALGVSVVSVGAVSPVAYASDDASVNHVVTVSSAPFFHSLEFDYREVPWLGLHAAVTPVVFTLPQSIDVLNLTSLHFVEDYTSTTSQLIATSGDVPIDPKTHQIVVPITINPGDAQGEPALEFSGASAPDPLATLPAAGGYDTFGNTLLLGVALKETTVPNLPSTTGAVDLSSAVAYSTISIFDYASADAQPVTVAPGDTVTLKTGRADFFHSIYSSLIRPPAHDAYTADAVVGSGNDALTMTVPAGLADYVDPAGHGTVLTGEVESDNDLDSDASLDWEETFVIAPLVLASHDDGTPYFADAQDPTATFYPYIQWMGTSGISRGTAQPNAEPLFEPLVTVSRQAMAEFLYRLSGETFDPGTQSLFADVTPSSPFNTAIQWMASKGISTGTAQDSGKPLFKPNDVVTREAMAAFLARYSNADLSTDPQQTGFADVAADSDFAAAIAWMNSAGISTGTAQAVGLPLYKPMDAVTRQAMAAFLYRIHEQ
jgi:hypothetical protein